jgi:hypothetical protein
VIPEIEAISIHKPRSVLFERHISKEEECMKLLFLEKGRKTVVIFLQYNDKEGNV